MLLPVSPPGIPFVEARVEGALQATGDSVRTKQFRFRSGTEARMKPLYEVKLDELGALLLRLGRALGEDLPRAAAAALEYPVAEKPVVPLATVGADGWVTVRLTRLVFPPFCCDCGAPTNQAQEFRGYAMTLRFGSLFHLEGGEFTRRKVPLCRTCQAEMRRAARTGALKGLGIGLGLAVLATLILWATSHKVQVFWMLLPLGLTGSLAGSAIGQAVGRRNAAPVQLRNFSSSKGTIAIRFRWPEYGERLLAFMEIQDAAPTPILSGTSP
jgi:hypothetical protein